MKKYSLLLIFYLVLLNESKAQFYIKAGTTVSFASQNELLPSGLNVKSQDPSVTIYTMEYKDIPLASGLYANVGFGYKLNENFAFEVDYNTKLNTIKTFTEDLSKYYTDKTYSLYFQNKINGTDSYTTQNHYFSLVGSYILPFKKLGIQFNLGPNVLISKVENDRIQKTPNSLLFNPSNVVFDNVEYSTTSTGGIQFGIQYGLGLSYPLTKQIDLNLDVCAFSNAYSYSTTTPTKSTLNGVDKLSSAYIPQKNNSKTDLNRIGINVGVKYFLKTK